MIITRMSSRASAFYRSITVISAVFVLSTCGPAFAKTVGRSGNIYRIAEPDALKELEDKVASTDLKERIKKEETTRRIERYRPSNVVSLPSAKKDRTSLMDMTYTLELDIPDGKGGVLYPKGFIFNPLDYIPFSRTIVVLNGAAENEVDWFTASEYYKRTDVLVLVTDGMWKELMHRFKRNVFYLTEPVRARFRLSSTPSVIVKKDNKYMEVKEIYVPAKKDSVGRRN